jgi:hypothetical protein
MRPSFLFCSVLVLGLCITQATGMSASAPTTAVLSVGVCATISQGDTLTLEWNPAFDHPFSVGRLQTFALVFAEPGEDRVVLRSHSGLRLIATAERGDPNPPISELANGYYRISFKPDLATIRPGVYHLVDAEAGVVPRADNQGELPAMTHNPAQSAFCLNVVSTTGSRGLTASR